MVKKKKKNNLKHFFIRYIRKPMLGNLEAQAKDRTPPSCGLLIN